MKENFISADGNTVINSYGEYFSVNELVKHEGAEGDAIIVGFEVIKCLNEIRAHTTKGYAHINFLVKVNEV